MQTKPTEDARKPSRRELLEKIGELEIRLYESEETLRAIREGEVDAVIVSGSKGEQIFSLFGADSIYRLIVETMREAAFTLTFDGTILFCNAQFCELLESPMERIVGHALQEFVAEAEQPAVPSILHAAQEQSIKQRLVFKAFSGKQVPTHISANLLKQPDEVSICIVANDLTDLENSTELIRQLRQQQEELKLARTAAEEASRAKDHFLAVLSHELRTPLTPVMMGVSMLQDNPEIGGPGVREVLDVIRRNVELEARLIDDLLDVTKIARGKIMLNRIPVKVSHIVRRAVEVCRPDVENRNLHLDVDLETASDIWVNADPSRLQQVFWNLLKNAIKFTPNEGQIRIRSLLNPGNVLVEVSDTGIGINPQSLPSIFNAFEQAEQTKNRQFGGLGLGLAISKALVEMHGGAITAESEGTGRGATFRIELPISAPELVAAAGVQDIPRSGVKTSRILLVEDHGVTAKMISQVLKAEGHEVEVASAVADGLQAAQNRPFDLLLSDLGLPDGSGHELLERLRTRGYTFPAIALSGYGQEDDVRKSHEAGFSSHLIKPASREQLLNAIASVLKKY